MVLSTSNNPEVNKNVVLSTSNNPEVNLVKVVPSHNNPEINLVKVVHSPTFTTFLGTKISQSLRRHLPHFRGKSGVFPLLKVVYSPPSKSGGAATSFYRGRTTFTSGLVIGERTTFTSGLVIEERTTLQPESGK